MVISRKFAIFFLKIYFPLALSLEQITRVKRKRVLNYIFLKKAVKTLSCILLINHTNCPHISDLVGVHQLCEVISSVLAGRRKAFNCQNISHSSLYIIYCGIIYFCWHGILWFSSKIYFPVVIVSHYELWMSTKSDTWGQLVCFINSIQNSVLTAFSKNM